MIGYLMDGGWMMIPLLICSIAMVAAIIDRARAFRCATKIDPDKMRAEVCEAVAAGDVDRAVKVCEEGEGPVAAVLLTGLRRLVDMREKGRSEAEIGAGVTKAMEDYAPRSMNGLEKRLGLLVLVASISPLIGMCGTVTGMINSFSVMAEAAGLDGLDWLRSLGITTICEGYNGIGPEFLKPEVRAMVSQYLAPFAPAAVVHDLRNHFGDGTREKFLMANDEFRRNCLKLAHYHYKQDPQFSPHAWGCSEPPDAERGRVVVLPTPVGMFREAR